MSSKSGSKKRVTKGDWWYDAERRANQPHEAPAWIDEAGKRIAAEANAFMLRSGWYDKITAPE